MEEDFLQPVIDWINAQPIQQWAAGTSWVVPGVQTVHIIAVAIVITGALVLALRGIGLTGMYWSMARWQARFRGATIAALWVLLATGIVMIIAEPERELLNWIFRTKMLLVIVTIIIMHLLGRRLRGAGADRPASTGARLTAIIVFLLWVLVATAGRWIAYAG